MRDLALLPLALGAGALVAMRVVLGRLSPSFSSPSASAPITSASAWPPSAHWCQRHAGSRGSMRRVVENLCAGHNYEVEDAGSRSRCIGVVEADLHRNVRRV